MKNYIVSLLCLVSFNSIAEAKDAKYLKNILTCRSETGALLADVNVEAAQNGSFFEFVLYKNESTNVSQTTTYAQSDVSKVAQAKQSLEDFSISAPTYPSSASGEKPVITFTAGDDVTPWTIQVEFSDSTKNKSLDCYQLIKLN